MDEVPGVSLFQGNSIHVENALQNQEEAEDIEDQRRRQEEIQSLLMKEMDDFNYDESSVNSSTNISMDEGNNELMEKYRNTSMNGQLKVLYEVRVREIMTLKKQLEELEKEYGWFKRDAKRQMLLLEEEKDKISISYKQTQDILVSKSEQIRKCNMEIDHLKSMINDLQSEVGSLKEDNVAYRCANEELQYKLSVATDGISTNVLTDKCIQEQHRLELQKLNSSLDAVLSKLDGKEIESKNLEQKLKEVVRDKEDLLVEKSSVINKLTAHLESAQTQSQELLEVIEKLSVENQSLKKAATAGNKSAASSVLELTEKSEFIKGMQRELEKSRVAYQKEAETARILKASCAKLEQELSENARTSEEKLRIATEANEKSRAQSDEICALKQKIEDLGYVQQERDAYDKRVRELEQMLMEIRDKSHHDAGMQVSAFLGDKEELERMEKDLNLAYHEMEKLQIKLSEARTQIESLSAQATLSKERDQLLKDLQEKAAHFEHVILETRKKSATVTASIATNTDKIPDCAEMLAANYEAELIRKEIDLRTALKREFDEKFRKMQSDFAQQQGKVNCTDCSKWLAQLKRYEQLLEKGKEDVKKSKEQLQEDRDAFVKLLTVWEEKFRAIETQNREINEKYVKAKSYCENMRVQLNKREEEEKKLVEMIKKEAETAVKYWNNQAMLQVIAVAEANKQKINEVKDKFDKYSKQADKEAEMIESEYRKKKKFIESQLKSYS